MKINKLFVFALVLLFLAILLTGCDGKEAVSSWVWDNPISRFFHWLLCLDPGSKVCWK